MLGINIDAPPPLPPRDPDMLSPKYDETRSLSSPFMPKNLVRQGSEHCLLSSSINLGSISNISDKYSITSGIFGRDKKPKNEEKSSSKGKRKKKSDTYSGRATPTGPSNGSPSKSSSMYFGNSPSHSRASGFSSSFNQSDLDKNSKKSKWFIIRKVGKKLSRSPSIDPDEVKKNIPQRSQSIPSVKKCGLYPGRSTSLSTEEPDGLTGLVSPRHRRRTSSLQVNSVNLVSKIFSVLSCWVNDYFEVSRGVFFLSFLSLSFPSHLLPSLLPLLPSLLPLLSSLLPLLPSLLPLLSSLLPLLPSLLPLLPSLLPTFPLFFPSLFLPPLPLAPPFTPPFTPPFSLINIVLSLYLRILYRMKNSYRVSVNFWKL